MLMRAWAFGLSDVGLQRDHNEDSFAVESDLNLFIVADGMGGHQAGDVASRLATEMIVKFFRSTTGGEEVTWPFDFDASLSEDENRLVSGVKLANRQIVELGNRRPELHGMGTTVVATLLSHDHERLFVAHVGDSRAYRVRGGTIKQLTRDHSLVNDYLEAMPGLSEEQRNELPRNVITRALGMQENIPVDLAAFEVEAGDTFLLCSDGLSGMVDDEDMCSVITGTDELEEACHRLINLANAHGGEDNITAVLIRAEHATSDAMRATLPDFRP
jgi:PPM family protein phosphatase